MFAFSASSFERQFPGYCRHVDARKRLLLAPLGPAQREVLGLGVALGVWDVFLALPVQVPCRWTMLVSIATLIAW